MLNKIQNLLEIFILTINNRNMSLMYPIIILIFFLIAHNIIEGMINKQIFSKINFKNNFLLQKATIKIFFKKRKDPNHYLNFQIKNYKIKI